MSSILPRSNQTILSPATTRVLMDLTFCAATAVLAVFLHFRLVNVADTDPFYHYTHAHIYYLNGPFYAKFPWATASIVSRMPGDLWYGFHLILAPFAPDASSVVDMKFASAFITALSVALLVVPLRMMNVSYPYVWPFLLVFASGDEMARLMMLRPQEVSIALAAIFMAAIARRRLGLSVLAIGLLMWVHLNMVWLGGIVVAAIVAALWFNGERITPRFAAGLIAGALAGWLLRPHPIWTSHLLYVQLVELFQVKLSGLDLDWGTELYAAKMPIFLAMYTPFLALWSLALVAAGLTWRRWRDGVDAQSRAFLAANVVLSIGFFTLTVTSASRSKDQWIAFATISLALLFTHAALPALRRKLKTSTSAVCCAGLIAVTAAFAAVSLPANAKLISDNFSPYRFALPCKWLRGNTRPGQIVFCGLWTYFPEMMFWDHQNRYIGAMDPIFEYALDKRKYWEWESFARPDIDSTVSDLPPSEPSPRIDVYTALRRDFHADYIVVFHQIEPHLLEHLESDPRFRLCYDDGGLAIFAIKPGDVR